MAPGCTNGATYLQPDVPEIKQFWRRALDAYRLKRIRINKTVSARACNARLSYFHVITLLKHLI